MTSDRTILITGVTGKQGGAVAQALQGSGFHLRGLTRKPDSERAAALARNGIDVVKGDLDDEATLRRALAGAWGVFGVQNAGEAGVEREEAQGKRLATLAREAGGGGDPDGGTGSADCVRADADRTCPSVQQGDGFDAGMVRARRLQRRYRWPGTRVQPHAHKTPRLGTPPRARSAHRADS